MSDQDNDSFARIRAEIARDNKAYTKWIIAAERAIKFKAKSAGIKTELLLSGTDIINRIIRKLGEGTRTIPENVDLNSAVAMIIRSEVSLLIKQEIRMVKEPNIPDEIDFEDKPQLHTNLDEYKNSDPLPDEQFIGKELSEDIKSILADHEEEELIALMRAQGYRLCEIADDLGISRQEAAKINKRLTRRITKYINSN